MSYRPCASPATAIVYTDGHLIDTAMRAIATHLKSLHWQLCGFVQLNEPQANRPRCTMTLQELSSGTRIGISEDRGTEARGCMLDMAAMARATAIAAAALDQTPDLLVINKFGKTEAAGRGFRSLIAEAFTRDIPLLIAVPRINLEEWRSYSAGLSSEHPFELLHTDIERVVEQLRLMRAIAALADDRSETADVA